MSGWVTIHPFVSVDTADVIRLREENQALEEAVIERTQLLMNAKRAWEATFDAIVDPLAIVSRDMRIVRTNLAHAAQSGVDVREINGKPCHDVLFSASAPCHGCPVVRTWLTGDAAQGEVTDSERERVFSVWSFPKRAQDGDGDFDEVVCHYKDVTEERELQRKLLQSEKMAAVGTLAGGVAHEISNPLGAILAFSQLGLTDAAPGTIVHDYLVEIEESAQRCKRIVSSLLDFSRPSRGERRPVDLVAVIEQAIFLCRTQYSQSRYKVTRELEDALPHVTGDKNQLGQVMLNLISNAFGALGDGGEVTIGAAADPGERVRIWVADDGVGIEPRYQVKVFEPFFTTKPEGKGTGLGLSISYSIVKDHGGTIEVESAVGVGTKFEIALPWPEEVPQDG